MVTLLKSLFGLLMPPTPSPLPPPPPKVRMRQTLGPDDFAATTLQKLTFVQDLYKRSHIISNLRRQVLWGPGVGYRQEVVVGISLLNRRRKNSSSSPQPFCKLRRQKGDTDCFVNYLNATAFGENNWGSSPIAIRCSS